MGFNLDNYVPVSERIVKFYEANPQGRITTAIQDINSDGLVIFQAQVFRNLDDALPSATGHAYEEKGNGHINKTSYIENCETSAIGRALANLGIEVQRGIASREEMQKVERMQATEVKSANGKLLASDLSGPKATASQITLLTHKATQAGSDLQTLVSQHYGGTDVENLTKDAATKLLNVLEGK